MFTHALEIAAAVAVLAAAYEVGVRVGRAQTLADAKRILRRQPPSDA